MREIDPGFSFETKDETMITTQLREQLASCTRAFCHFWHGSGNWVIRAMTRFAKEIYLFICNSIGRGDPAPSIDQIAKYAKCGRTSTSAALSWLKMQGWLDCNPNWAAAADHIPPRRMPNTYAAMIPKDHAPRPDRPVLTRKQQLAKIATGFLEQRIQQINRFRWNQKYGIDLTVDDGSVPAGAGTNPTPVNSDRALCSDTEQYLSYKKKRQPIFSHRRKK